MYELKHTCIFTISSRMNNVGCSVRAGLAGVARSRVSVASALAPAITAASSNEISEDATLLIVSVIG
jgi:hypothetical protein